MPKNLRHKKLKDKNSDKQIPENVSFRSFLKNSKRYDVNITDKTLDSQIMKKRDALTWNITFRKENINAASIIHLKNTLKLTKKIQKISFVFSVFNLPYHSRFNNIPALTGLPFIQSISLFFVGSPRITDNHIDKIQTCLKKLRFLKEVSLSFAHYDGITNNGLQNLSKCLRTFLFVQKIELSFWNCQTITDFGLYYLSKGFKRLTSLKSIKLSFYQNRNVVDKGLQALSKSLKGLRKLQTLDLCFNYCEKIIDDGFCSLCEVMEKLIVLQKVRIVFIDCKEITLPAEQKMTETFIKHPSFQKFASFCFPVGGDRLKRGIWAFESKESTQSCC